MCSLVFSTDFTWNTFHSKKNAAEHNHESENVFMNSIWIFSSDFLKKFKYQISSKSIQ